MFVVLLTYTQSLEAVDSLVPAHREFLQQMYESGTFLLSGRKQPRDGGVILANAESRQCLDSALANDPFQIHGVASYQVMEFIPTMAAPALQTLVRPDHSFGPAPSARLEPGVRPVDHSMSELDRIEIWTAPGLADTNLS